MKKGAGHVLARHPGMPKHIAIIQNDPDVPAGVFGDLLTAWQVPFHLIRPDVGEVLPARTAGVIVLGGVMGVHDEAAHPFLRPVKQYLAQLLANGTPLLGICLGGQLLAEVAGGAVSSNRCGERGLVEIALTAAGGADRLFAGLGPRFAAFQWHNDSFTVPAGTEHLAFSGACPGQAFRIGKAWGVQFHPEVDGTIVAAWSRHDPRRGELTGEFAAVETEHRALAGQLLANFSAIAGIRPAGR